MKTASHTIIVPYSSDWPTAYESEKEILLKSIGSKIIDIQHIGSTSIPGLSSKPIVDIAVIIQRHEDAEALAEHVMTLGYTFHSKSSERHFFIKGDPIRLHLSIAYADQGGFWMRQIVFRNYLRAHPEALQEYALLKEQLLRDDPSGKGAYFAGKTDFVYRILKLAGWKEGQLYQP